jgi:hypothetical protein
VTVGWCLFARKGEEINIGEKNKMTGRLTVEPRTSVMLSYRSKNILTGLASNDPQEGTRLTEIYVAKSIQEPTCVLCIQHPMASVNQLDCFLFWQVEGIQPQRSFVLYSTY